jgi:intracellular sulfur oxidation DsrE/DsrF family protein
MAIKTLSIVESAYRATIEEQDDTIVWLHHAMKGAGGDFTVVLRGNAVNYAVKGQDASGLSFGDWKQTQPANILGDVESLVGKGVDVYVVEEDVAELGLEGTDLTDKVKTTKRADIAGMVESHDRVWHW